MLPLVREDRGGRTAGDPIVGQPAPLGSYVRMGEPLKASKRESHCQTSLPFRKEKGPRETTWLRGGGWTAGNRPEPTRAHGRGWIPTPLHTTPPTHAPASIGACVLASVVQDKHFSSTPPIPYPNLFRTRCVGERVVSVAESVLDPPGPIPNPVVTQNSAGEYCGSDSVGGEAAADTTLLHTPHPFPSPHTQPGYAAGWSSGSSLGS